MSATLHVIYPLASLLAILAFYVATPHQRLWTKAGRHALVLRMAGVLACGLAVAAAVAALGTTAGVCAALTTLMTMAVVVPYLDAWCNQRRQR